MSTASSTHAAGGHAPDGHAAGPRRAILPMRPRDPHEAHRAATPLELLFDLCFVVAIAQAAASLHHGLGAGHVAHAILNFGLVFFAIWWAWMNFTWFASAYDCDDVPYRLKVLVQIVGVLIIAAGVPRAFEHQDYSLVTIGYAVMRIAMIAQWLRAARADANCRATAGRYALGIALCQLGWIGAAFLPTNLWLYGFLVLMPLEILVPMWAERANPTPWHAHHIAERYSLLTLIVLGESVLSATLAIQSGVDSGHLDGALIAVIVGAVLILFSLWWIYFEEPAVDCLRTPADAFRWGYAHYVVFATLAAAGAGFAVAVDALTGGGHDAAAHGEAAAHGASLVPGLAVTLPVAMFLLVMWALTVRPRRPGAIHHVLFLGAAATIALLGLTPYAVIGTGVICAVLVAARIRLRAAPPEPHAA